MKIIKIILLAALSTGCVSVPHYAIENTLSDCQFNRKLDKVYYKKKAMISKAVIGVVAISAGAGIGSYLAGEQAKEEYTKRSAAARKKH